MKDETTNYAELYRLASLAGTAVAFITPLAIVVFILWPPPYDGTVLDWFEVFRDDWLVGLLSMDLLLILVLLLEVPILLGLYVALRPSNATLMAVALAFGLLGIGLHLSSITAFEMLSLSRQYFDSSTTETEKVQLLSAGESMLATYEGTRFHLNYVVGGTLVPALISLVMLGSNVFGRPVVYVGFFAALFNLGLYVPEIGLTLSVFSGLAFLVWYVLLALRFHAMAKDDGAKGDRVSRRRDEGA